jgi:hypothetical protein
MQLRKLKLAILAASLAGAMSASASLTVYETGVNPGEVINISVPGFYTGGAWAGIYNLTVNTLPTPSFCVDVWRFSPSGAGNDYSYTALESAPVLPGTAMGTDAATKVEKLWAKYFPQIGTVADHNLEAAALQVAIWETVAHGNGKSFSVGAGAVATLADTMYNDPDLGNVSPAHLIGLVSPTTQNYAVPVPEPTTLIAGALLLLPFGASTMQSLRKNRAA